MVTTSMIKIVKAKIIYWMVCWSIEMLYNKFTIEIKAPRADDIEIFDLNFHVFVYHIEITQKLLTDFCNVFLH